MDELSLEVRDYELDSQGIVNNAVYQNYFEHGRHRCIQKLGLDFQTLQNQGWDLVVVRAEIDYQQSLRSNDSFLVWTTVELSGKLRYIFWQELSRVGDQRSITKAKFTVTGLFNGHPRPCPLIIDAVTAYTAAAKERL